MRLVGGFDGVTLVSSMGVSTLVGTCSALCTVKGGRERYSEEGGGDEACWEDGRGRTKLRARSGREGSDGREREERAGEGEAWGVWVESDSEWLGGDCEDDDDEVDGTVDALEILLAALLDA